MNLGLKAFAIVGLLLLSGCLPFAKTETKAAASTGNAGFIPTPTSTPTSTPTVTASPTPTPVAPELSGLYGYSLGANSFLRAQLATFCSRASAELPASRSLDGFGYFYYGISLKALREYGAAFFSSDLRSLSECLKKTGSTRLIIVFNFYEFDRDPATNAVFHFQKQQLCRIDKKPMSPHCRDTKDAKGNVIKRGYIAPDLVSARADFDSLLSSLGRTLTTTFDGSTFSVIAGISLSEENVTWDYVGQADGSYRFASGSRATFLDNLYGALKIRYPSVNFIQWYSPHKIPNFPGYNATWPQIGADGWIFDQYLMASVHVDGVEQSTYYQYVTGMASLNVPLYSIVFASPNRNPSAAPSVDPTWWNTGTEGAEAGWTRYYAQVAINQAFHIPTSFYAYTPMNGGDVPLTARQGACGTELFTFLRTKTWPWTKSHQLSLTLPSTRPEWIPLAPAQCD